MHSNKEFRNKFAEDIWNYKYNQGRFESFWQLSNTLCYEVCGGLMPDSDIRELVDSMSKMKWLPGGRYIYYAGRNKKFYNNCFLYRSMEDTREDWSNTFRKISAALMTGGGIGNDYSIYRPSNSLIASTGGVASGPIPAMNVVNDLGRQVMQGGSRRSAMYASLNWQHGDIDKFLLAKDWHNMSVKGTSKTLWDLKVADFNFPAPLDMTNISVNYDTAWLKQVGGERLDSVFLRNVAQALKTGEPGMSFNFFENENETLRNAPVSGNTRVLTTDGYVSIKDIVDEPVTVWTGKQWASTTFKKTFENADTVKVSFSGNRNIVAELEHPFLVERQLSFGRRSKYEIVRIPAKDLKAGDTLVSTLPDVEDTLPLNSKYYTLGYIFGDGSFSKYGCETTIADKSKLSCVDKFYVSSIRKQSITPQGYTRIYFSKFEEVSSKNEFPIFMFNDERTSFLAGLFDTDGSYDAKRNMLRFSSSRKNHIDWVRENLEMLGIHSTVSKPTIPQYSTNPNWTLVIQSSDLNIFSKLIPTTRLKVAEYTPYRKSKIKVLDVSPSLPEDVFCCNVGVEEHSFCAEGVIVSNCCELTSEDDSDVCNLASINFSQIKNLRELEDITRLVIKFQICATIRAELPHAEVYATREKNRRLGNGIMGLHEWLLSRGHKYEMCPELAVWLGVWRNACNTESRSFANRLSVSVPAKNRAIAPTGSIAILAGTTGGIEPLYAVAYKRRYLKEGTKWHYQYVVDSVAEELIQHHGIDPDKIETSLDLAKDPERRIKFQADVQDFVDHAISSTINLPAWGTAHNNEDKVTGFASLLAKYAPRLRGFTCYPDGARGGQPLTTVPYKEAKELLGSEFEEHIQTNDVCEIGGKGGSCGS
jgi:ribonucleotide reductase alpha subunit